MAPEDKAPEARRAASPCSRLRALAYRHAAAVVAGALAIGLLVMAAAQRSTTSFVADGHALRHPFVRAVEEAIRRRLGVDARVSEVRLERSRTLLTLRARMSIAGGGVVDFQASLDGRGTAEPTGMLRAQDIVVRRDSVAGHVLQKAEEYETTPSSEQRSARPAQVTLESIQVPFSIRHGQLVIHDAVLNGRLVNAALRGKVDLGSQTIDASGTFLPMSRLTWVAMPTLLTGPYGEGLFGVSFAIQGPLAKPEVIVHPAWLIPPGFLRKIFEVQPREATNQ